MQAVSMHSYEEIAQRLAQSKFRSRFRLGRRELACVAEKGFPVIEAQCREIIRRRLGPAVIPNDGRQTPWRGHPCFIAQHATGCCCRGCLRKRLAPRPCRRSRRAAAYAGSVLTRSSSADLLFCENMISL